jgi:predicted glycosyltransferase
MLPDDLNKYQITIPPDKMHDALYYSTLFYGESATMASECAVCGTPGIYLDNVGRGYTDEQEDVYGSVFNFTESSQDQERSIAKGVELLRTDKLKEIWKEKSRKILNDKIDVTAFIVDLLENYLEVTRNVRNSRNNKL